MVRVVPNVDMSVSPAAPLVEPVSPSLQNLSPRNAWLYVEMVDALLAVAARSSVAMVSGLHGSA
eukprot:53903-Eustigmatos_ZCMA.PRE.1